LKKLSFFLIIFLLVLASATYLYYNHWHSAQRAEEASPYIPQSAALVYEVADFGKQWEHFRQMPMAKTLNQVPGFSAIQHGFSFLKNLVEAPQSLDKVPLTVSVHGLGEERLGCIFYFNTHDAATRRILEAITLKIKKEKAIRNQKEGVRQRPTRAQSGTPFCLTRMYIKQERPKPKTMK